MAMRRGREAASGSGYSRISSVRGSTLPTLFVPNATQNTVPFEFTAIPYRRDFGVGGVRSLITPVSGSTRPSMFVIWLVYQSAPSLVASGSCGRDPGVSTCHSLIETLAGPGITAPAGFDFSGKFLVKYSVTVASWSAGTTT